MGRPVLTRRSFLATAAAAMGLHAGLAGAEAWGGPRAGASPVPLLRDPQFRRGFTVCDPAPGKHVERGRIAPGPASEPPAWFLDQWNSRFTLAGAAGETLQGGAVRFADAAKAVTFGPPGGPEGDLVLALHASKEYGDRLRREGEPWPHLLVEQRVEAGPALAALASLRLHVECRLPLAVPRRGEGWTPGLHAAQFQAFLTVQNLNRASAGCGDYLWFGVPLYDSRSRIPPPHAARDTAGTDKFIYMPGGEAYTDRSAHDGAWITVNSDLLPLIRKGLEAAWQRDFLRGSRDLADYRPSSFNMGWELPGTLDVAMQVRNLSLAAETK